MDLLSRIRNLFADDRFDANLIALYALIVAGVVCSLILRRLLTTGHLHLSRWSKVKWLDSVGGEASRRRTLLFWVTLASVFGATAAGAVYHLAGRDVRDDLRIWYDHLTWGDLFRVGTGVAELGALWLAAKFSVALLRRLLPKLEAAASAMIGETKREESLRRWFVLTERYATVSVRVTAFWAAAAIIGIGELAGNTLGIGLLVLTILVAARLLTLAWHTVSQAILRLGDLHLGQGRFQRYWDRFTRLIPFAERCFEAAVYVTAAWLCVLAFEFVPAIYHFGPRIVGCIGILFASRVLIELTQVLLNQAFGIYDEHHHLDQKGQTLVPLLHSVCQYVMYFGSAVIMLDVLGLNTMPILAGAGILGLAVGLGAQSLVTDLVSGFFILFEGQYLVGDFVQIGEAAGVVEAVGIRLTQIRDTQGKLYIIPNGQIKGVTNYSKGYVNAVVDYKVPAGSDLEAVFRAMAEAGKRLRHVRKEVLADTEILGLVDFGTSDMTVRALTKVQPGAHVAMQNEYRRFLKQVLDQANAARKDSLAA